MISSLETPRNGDTPSETPSYQRRPLGLFQVEVARAARLLSSSFRTCRVHCDVSFVALAGVDAVPVVRARAPHRCSRASAAAARATNHAACISGELLDRVGGLHLAGDQNGSPLVSCYAASCPACDPSQARIG